MSRTKITIQQPSLWQRPFDGSTLAIVSMASGVVLWRSMYPSFHYMVAPFAVGLLWALLAVLVLVRLVIAEAGCRLTGRRIHWRGMGGTLALLTAVSAAALLKLPLHLGFAFARPAFDQAIAQDLEPGESFPLANSSYGPYSVIQQARRRDRERHADRIYFTLADDTEAGFVYSESGIDDLRYNAGSKGHLTGNWYWMAED